MASCGKLAGDINGETQARRVLELAELEFRRISEVEVEVEVGV